MSTIRNKLVVNQGTSYSVNVEVEADIDLNEYVISGQFRKTYTSQYYVDFRFNIVDETNFSLYLEPEDTLNLQDGLYVFDVEIEKDGVVHRILEGDLLLRPRVTREG